jgi:hypothetical protein
MSTAALKQIENVLPMRIGGKEVLARSGKSSEIVNPATGEVIALVAEGAEAEADVNDAVTAAKQAFKSGIWRKKSSDEKGRVLACGSSAYWLRPASPTASSTWSRAAARPVPPSPLIQRFARSR